MLKRISGFNRFRYIVVYGCDLYSIGRGRLVDLYFDGNSCKGHRYALRGFYYVSGRSLFGFDKETEEMESYSKNNILNDIDIANIYYNYDKSIWLSCMPTQRRYFCTTMETCLIYRILRMPY